MDDTITSLLAGIIGVGIIVLIIFGVHSCVKSVKQDIEIKKTLEERGDLPKDKSFMNLVGESVGDAVGDIKEGFKEGYKE